MILVNVQMDLECSLSLPCHSFSVRVFLVSKSSLILFVFSFYLFAFKHVSTSADSGPMSSWTNGTQGKGGVGGHGIGPCFFFLVWSSVLFFFIPRDMKICPIPYSNVCFNPS